MKSYRNLLPPNASDLECAYINCVPRGNLIPAAEKLSNLFAKPPEDYKAWLLAEWNLSQFSSYFKDYDTALNAGLPWLFERGSLYSVERAMGWLGYQTISIEEDQHLIHINPGSAIAANDLKRIEHVVNASLPAHSKFYRMVYGRDLRAGFTDRSQFDACLFDDDSGNWSGEPGLSLKLDFLLVSNSALSKYQRKNAISCYRDGALKFITDDLSMRFDSWVLDSVVIPLSIVSIAEVSTQKLAKTRHETLILAYRPISNNVLSCFEPRQPIKALVQHHQCTEYQMIPRYGWKDMWQKKWAISYQRIETIRSI